MCQSFAKLHIHFFAWAYAASEIFMTSPAPQIPTSNFVSTHPCLCCPSESYPSHTRTSFPCLLFLSQLPPPELPSLPCPRPAPIRYHLTWHCVLGSIQWQRHTAPFSLDIVSFPWNRYPPLSLLKKKRCKFQALGTKGYYNIPMGCVAITRLITSLLQNIPVFQLRYSIALCKRCSESCADIPLCRHCSAALSPSSASSLISRVTVKQACGNFFGARPDANSNTSCHQYCSATDQILPPPPPTFPTQALMKTNLLHAPIVFIRRKSFILNVLEESHLPWMYYKSYIRRINHFFMHLLQKICFVFVLYIFCKYV